MDSFEAIMIDGKYDDMPVLEACDEFNYDIQNLLHEFDMRLLIGEHQYFTENGYEMKDSPDYFTEGVKDMAEKAKNFIKRMMEYIKNIYKKVSAWCMDWVHKFQVWRNTVKIDDAKLKSGLTELEKDKDSIPTWSYVARPEKILTWLGSVKGTDIAGKNKEQAETFIKVLNGDESEGEMDLSANQDHTLPDAKQITDFINKATSKNEMSKNMKTIYDEAQKAQEALWKQCKGADAAAIELIQIRSKASSAFLSKGSKLLIKIGSYYKSVAQAAMSKAKSDDKDKKGKEETQLNSYMFSDSFIDDILHEAGYDDDDFNW